VQIKRHIERFAGLEDGPELRVVQIFVMRVRVYQRALESQFGDRALDFLGGMLRILWRARGERRKAIRMFADRCRHLIVGQHRQ
jgi:hypothetical protein